MIVALLAAAAVQAAPATPANSELWQGAKVGMTPDQVQAAFPGAKPVVDGEALLDNAKERLTLDGVKLATGETASANFFFRGESLNEVKLVLDVPRGARDANVKRASAVADAFTRTYGKPASCGPREGLLAYECDWLAGDLSVSVTYMDVGGESPLLEATIRAVVDSDAQVPRAPATRTPTNHPVSDGIRR